jgi:hypothetical protein
MSEGTAALTIGLFGSAPCPVRQLLLHSPLKRALQSKAFHLAQRLAAMTDWTAIEGAYFDCWRYEQHVVQPFEVPAQWARFRSMDWGSAKPFSVGWWAIVSDDYYVPRAEGGSDRPKELIAARLRPFHAADNSRVPHRGSMGGWISCAPAWSAKMVGPGSTASAHTR